MTVKALEKKVEKLEEEVNALRAEVTRLRSTDAINTFADLYGVLGGGHNFTKEEIDAALFKVDVDKLLNPRQ